MMSAKVQCNSPNLLRKVNLKGVKINTSINWLQSPFTIIQDGIHESAPPELYSNREKTGEIGTCKEQCWQHLIGRRYDSRVDHPAGLTQTTMTADERNFRSSYYEKVGFRNVEEKKSLEILLKDKPLNSIKLKQFCLRFTVPGVYRNLLWKILLNVTPRYLDNLGFVTRQRTAVFEELFHALCVMKLVNHETSKPELFLLMWLLETGQLKFDLSMQMDDKLFKGFISISKSLVKMFDEDVDIYWISKGFYNTVKNFHDSIPKLIEATQLILEREDKVLYKHLLEIGIFDPSFIGLSFLCLFADILHETALVKIWDKIVGGSFKILPFVAVILFTTLRRSLLNLTSKVLALDEMKSVSEAISEVVANKAIELWQQYGSPLITGDSRKEKGNTDIL